MYVCVLSNFLIPQQNGFNDFPEICYFVIFLFQVTLLQKITTILPNVLILFFISFSFSLHPFKNRENYFIETILNIVAWSCEYTPRLSSIFPPNRFLLIKIFQLLFIYWFLHYDQQDEGLM